VLSYIVPVALFLCVAGTVAVTSILLAGMDIKRFAAASSVLHLQVCILLLLLVHHSLLVVGAMLQLAVHS